MTTRVYTINGLYRVFEKQICEFQKGISDEVLYLDVNFSHPMEMGMSHANFGVYWLASLCNTGHEHIVLLPVLNRSPDRWPVAFYDQMNGTARTFASSIRNWFPSYLIYLSARPNYRKYFGTFAGELVEHCRECFNFDAEQLVEGRYAGTMSTAQAYALTEPDSFLYHSWLRSEGEIEGVRQFALQQHESNLPLRWLLERSALDGEVCWQILNRNLRFDLGDSWRDVLRAVAPYLGGRARGTAFEPLVGRILAGEREWRAAASYFQAAQDYLEKGEPYLAFQAFENAFFLEGAERGQDHAEAFRHLVRLGREIGGRGYGSYINELNLG